MILNNVLREPHYLLGIFLIIILGIYIIFQNTFIPLESIVVIHLTTFLIFFSISYILSNKLFSALKLKKIRPFLPKFLVYLITILAIFLSLYKMYYIFTNFNLETFMAFRSLTNNPDNDFGEIISIHAGLSFPLSLVAYLIAKKSNDKLLKYFFIITSLAIAIVSTSKMFLLIWIILLTYQSNITLMKIILVSLVFILFFALSHILLEKFSSNPDDGVLTAVFNTFLVYLIGALAGYQNLVNGKVEIDEMMMFYGLKPFINIFTTVKFSDTAILPWTYFGNWNGNNYTAFGYWYAYFKDYYIFIVSVYLGGFYGFIFAKNKLFLQLFEYYKFFLIFTLFFMLFGDQFFPAFNMHIVYVLSSILLALTKIKYN